MDDLNALTLFRERFPWREKLLRMDWPSTLYRGEISCNPCRATSGRDGEFSVYEPFGDREAFL